MTPSPVSLITPDNVEVRGPVTAAQSEILTPEAMAFVASLHRQFGHRRDELLVHRHERQAALDRGERPDFLAETQHIRDGDWTVAPTPDDIQDRRVEITGPTDRKMVINALNSGARVFMTDFEDANSPTWANMLDGQINLRDAIRRTISFANPDGKQYALNEKTAVLFVRPRGWHLLEKALSSSMASRCRVDCLISACTSSTTPRNCSRAVLVHIFTYPRWSHTWKRGCGTTLSCSRRTRSALPQGTIKATVLIETILAAFEMDEILYELKAAFRRD